MLAVHGIIAIPRDSALQISNSNNRGYFMNFKVVSQGRSTGDSAVWQYWDASMWVPEDKIEHWKTQVRPGNIFLIEHSTVTTYPVQEGKYHNTKLKLEHSKIKKLDKPMWTKD